MKSALGQGMRRRDKLFFETVSVCEIALPSARSGVIEPKSPASVSPNGCFLENCRRLSAIRAPNSANWECADGTKCAKIRSFRPIRAFRGDQNETSECLAGAEGFELRYGELEIRGSRLSERSCRTCLGCKSKVLRNVGISRTVPNRRSPELRREMGLSENNEPALPIRSPKLE